MGGLGRFPPDQIIRDLSPTQSGQSTLSLPTRTCRVAVGQLPIGRQLSGSSSTLAQSAGYLLSPSANPNQCRNPGRYRIGTSWFLGGIDERTTELQGMKAS